MIVASGGIVLALAGVVIATIYLHKHWKAIWHEIKKLVAEAWAWIKKHTELIAMAFGPIGLAIKVFADHWKTIWAGIKAVISEVAKIIHSIIGGIASAIANVTHAVSSIANNPIVKGIGGVVSGIGSFFSGGGSSAAKSLTNNSQQVTPLAPPRFGASRFGQQAPANVTIHIAGSVISENDLVTRVRDGIGQGMRRRGLSAAALGI